MSIANLPDWPFWITGGVLCLTGFGFFWRGLFSDRSRGGPRCPKCWYDLRGAVEKRCSECGFVWTRPKQVLRRRRYWRAVVIGFVLFVGGLVATRIGPMSRDGALAGIPTIVIILMAPDAGTPEPANYLRMDPIANRWVGDWRYRELRRRDAGGEIEPWEWQALVKHKHLIHTRARWPRDVPIVVVTHAPEWMSSSVRLTRSCPDGASAIIERTNRIGPALKLFAAKPDSLFYTLGVGSAPDDSLMLDGSVLRNAATGINKTPLLVPRNPEFTHTLPIHLVASVDEAITPVSDVRTTEIVRRKLTLRADVDVGALTVRWDFNRDGDPAIDDVAVALAIDVIRHDRVIATLRSRSSQLDGDHVPIDCGVTRPPPSSSMYVRRQDIDLYTLRIHGDGERALLDFDRNHYWAGEFTIPLREIISAESLKPPAFKLW